MLNTSEIAPGPKPRPIVGSLPERKNDPLHLFVQCMRDYGDVVRLKFGPALIHLVNSPEHIKHVLQENSKNYIKGFGYDKLEPVLGHGLLTSEGEFWRRQRKLAQPAFHRQRLESFANTMNDATQNMLKRWEKIAADGHAVEVTKEMMQLTLTVVSRTLLNTDVSADAEVVGAALTRLIADANHNILSLIQIPERVPTPRNLRIKRDRDTLNAVVYSIIEERRKNPTDRGDLLSMLMAARDEDTGEGMTDAQLRDEVMTIFLAGHETTANLLSWTWILLSRHPHVERKLREEIEQLVGTRTPTFYDLPKFRYTTMVLEESMRLYPPAWVFSRQAVNDDYLGQIKIPAKSIIVLSPYAMHRHPRYWENPEGFDPERFAPELKEARPKYAYFPFAGGPRQCIGTNFAMMEAQLVLINVLQKFKLHLVPGTKIEPEPLLTLRPRYPVWMSLKTNL